MTTMPMFYDVPAGVISTGKGYRMAYAIFDCAFEAMSYARHYANHHVVNRRKWDQRVFEKSVIWDFRNKRP